MAVIKPVSLAQTWKAMEALVAQGKVRAIGVSNFTRKHLEELAVFQVITPSANQFELHPHLPQAKLVSYCQQRGIQAVAYSPLGSGREPALQSDPGIRQMADNLGISPSQFILSWAISRGTPVIVRSTNPQHLEENAHLQFIDAPTMERAANLILKHHRFIDPVNFWKLDCFEEEEL